MTHRFYEIFLAREISTAEISIMGVLRDQKEHGSDGPGVALVVLLLAVERLATAQNFAAYRNSIATDTIGVVISGDTGCHPQHRDKAARENGRDRAHGD